MITSPGFAGKRYAVLGLARSGLSAVETLLASGAEVIAWDAREEPRLAMEGRVELADPATADLAGIEAVVVSPGIALNRHPIAEAAARAGVPVIGDIELFARARPSLPPHKVVGITGTNGKSTTTALVAHLLEAAGVPARMGGNIGVPILGEDPLPAGGIYVLELSSYQLDLTLSLDCDVAVLLNITPDHLDRHGTFEAYAASKARLFDMQSPGRAAIFTGSDIPSRQLGKRLANCPRGESLDVLFSLPDVKPIALASSGGVNVSTTFAVVEAKQQVNWPSLQGPHNAQNAAAAMAAAHALDIPAEAIEQGLRTFPGLPHRMERVAEGNGVLFVNDSKATNPASTAPALAAFPPDPVSSRPRIHWIVGGLPKGDSLDECRPWFGNVAAAYAIGEAGPAFAELLAPIVPVHRSELMAEAIRQAIADARPGDVVLLSPACASFDQFRDFEARGEAFRRIVAAYLAEAPADARAARKAAG